MNDVAVHVSTLGKRYFLDERGPRTRLRARLETAIRASARGVASAVSASRAADSLSRRADRPHLWALEDVSFELPDGGSLALVGANGAGKSVLLKILSRVTKPTVGHARLRGRVGALLEVGAGFHEELTGRENILMSGTLLGMTKQDVRRRFDEIAAFSGLETHLDTPVKWYSTGMCIRLGTAVALHLDVDILLVDEVLAVCDDEFCGRTVARLKAFVSAGGTILYVSHDLATVEHLCDRALLMKQGRVEMDGTARDVVRRYEASRM